MAEPEKVKLSKTDKDTRRTSRATPLVFIGHDSRDAELAEAFSKLLSSVSAGVLKSFRSSDHKGSQGIEYGVEWYPELMSKLESASDVVCLLTQQSLDRPWILYEAGVAKGKLDTPVYGVALGIPLSRANKGPFAQFQNCDDKEGSLTKLVLQLLQRIPDSEPDKEAVRMQVDSFKEKAQTLLKGIRGNEESPEMEAVDASSVAKLFEEVKVMFQDLPSRIEGRIAEGVAPIRRPPMRYLHPMMLEEMIHMLGEGPDDPIGLTMLAGLVRDDFPWLYEIIMEAHREVKGGDAKTARLALKRIRRATEIITHSPFMEELGYHSKEMRMFIGELPMFIDHYLRRIEKKAKRIPSKK